MTRIAIEVEQVERIMSRLMAEVPELAEDEGLRLDTLEGCTEGIEALRIIVRLMQEADAFASGLDATIEQMQARKARFVKQVATYRDLIQRIMEAAEVAKVQVPEATLSLRPGPPKVVIGAEDEIPAEYFRHEIRPNLSAIRDALKAGTSVPGASLSNGAPSLTVRAN